VKIKDFEKLKQEKPIEEIIKKHCKGEIWLTDRQLSKLLKQSRKGL